ncbi:hypothetical protein K2Z83_14920 [Oscillochloris sp. ZM17-4]|uniref:hypothetical protein n=1 Tax=Oscillochloris sp. ZM17-4 TaxID=2866714 RepID=UPI001C72B6B3|nr:hypothetical protein [Oscillochloris sp. ZM17-4]MBX0328968.1 hypothetical protein [Oscillochloris sp. ZM17-4]
MLRTTRVTATVGTRYVSGTGATFLSEWASIFCRGRRAKKTLLRTIYRHLWRGEVDAAINCLESYRPEARTTEWLDKLIGYLDARHPLISDYGQRRRTSQYIGSGQAEKDNDQIVGVTERLACGRAAEAAPEGPAAAPT